MKVHIVYSTYTTLGKLKLQSGEEIIGAYADYETALVASQRTKEKFEQDTGLEMRSRFDEQGCYIYTDDDMRYLIEISTLEVE